MKKINFIGFWDGFNNGDNFIKNNLFNSSGYELTDSYTENDYESTYNNECKLTDNTNEYELTNNINECELTDNINKCELTDNINECEVTSNIINNKCELTDNINECEVTSNIINHECELTDNINECELTDNINKCELTNNINECELTNNINECELTDNINESVLANNINECKLADNINEREVTDNINESELADNTNEYKLADNINECKLKYNNNILIIGPMINEDNYNLILKLKCYKIIYISEPIEKFEHYNYIYNLYINNKYDLITGSINNDVNENKYKYPFYLCYFNYRDSSNIFKNVNTLVKSYNRDDILSKNFVTLINTHDMHNTRIPIYEKLKDIDHIACPSNLLNNCSNEELNRIGNIEYIKKFKYNICSENCITNVGGYITEKLLNCCLAGSIPIYYGSFDDIDEKIFNKDRILFFDGLNEDSLNNIRNKVIYFRDNEEEFINFYKQDVFCENAHLVIDELERNLIDKIRNI